MALPRRAAIAASWSGWRAGLTVARFVRLLARLAGWTWPWIRLVLIAAPVVLVVRDVHTAYVVAGVLGIVAVALGVEARRRVVVQEVMDYSRSDANPKKPAALARGVATLLVDELARLSDLYRGVDEGRDVSSDMGHSSPLAANVSLGSLDETLSRAVSRESTLTIGPVAVPIGVLLALLGRLVTGPRLVAAVHDVNGRWIMTAQLTAPGAPTRNWRVAGEPGSASRSPASVPLTVVQELARRIFVDLSLGGAIGWQAATKFVAGLELYRTSLGSARDRVPQLNNAERCLMEALAADERASLVYYNLGVVYSALRSARSESGERYRRAAEAAFLASVERNPRHWLSYYALATGRVHRKECRPQVIELCQRIIALKPGGSGRARAYDLMSLAHLQDRDLDAARRCGLRASRAALGTLVWGRLRDGSERESARPTRLTEQASVCLMRLAVVYGERARSQPSRLRGVRAIRSFGLFDLALKLIRRSPRSTGALEYPLRFNYGHMALDLGSRDVAVAQLRAATRVRPDDVRSLACLAQAHADAGQVETAIRAADKASELLLVRDASTDERAIVGHDSLLEHDHDHDPFSSLISAYETARCCERAALIRRRRDLARELRAREKKANDGRPGQRMPLADRSRAHEQFERWLQDQLDREDVQTDAWQVGYVHSHVGEIAGVPRAQARRRPSVREGRGGHPG